MAKENPKDVALLEGIKRLDATTKYVAVEVERSGEKIALHDAAIRLRNSNKPQRVLIVPEKSLNSAKKVMQEIGVSGTLRNLSDTYRRYVPAAELSPKRK